MPSLFSSKNKDTSSSSSKPSRSPLVGSSSSTPSEQQYNPARATPEDPYRAHQAYRPAPGQHQHQQPQQQAYLQTAPSPAQGAPQSFDRPPIDVAAAVNAGQRPPPNDQQRDIRHPYQQQYLQKQDAETQAQIQAQAQAHAHAQALAAQQAAIPPPQEGKRGIRERLFGHSSRDSVDQGHGGGGKVLSRRESIRRKDSPHKQSPSEDRSSKTSSAYWASGQSSTANLAVAHEADEEGHLQHYDPRLQQVDPRLQQISPPVPAKDYVGQPQQFYQQQQQQQQYPPQQVPQPYGEFAPPRTLLPRVNTNQSSNSSHGVQELHSASEYSAGSIQPTPGLLQEGFQQPPGQPQQQQYKALPPTGQQPPPGHQLPQDPSRDSYYQSQDTQTTPQPIRVSGHGPPQPPPHAQLPQQEQHFGQPPVYQSPEIRSPQPIRGNLQVQPQAPPQGQLYPPRPSSQQHHAPPSPLNPAHQRQFDRASSPGQAPSSSSDESAQPLAAGSKQPQPGPPQSQGQAQGPRNSSEMPSHGGQGASRDSRYDGQSQSAPTKLHRPPREDSDLRRSTPPPRHGDDDEATQYEQLVKEHRELREKYQKVKKYYFEKEAQVHALQNTIAHQRLSQSRTSLDDSEYAGRFSRLDGLISQLAFSIRKDWKSLPQWLQPGVNRDAVAVGKQEMTVCGRAVISQWLNEELFESFFHTDLEPGLSMQLKQVQMNIRKYAPPFQSGEEEEALHAKIISWRLATLEGLQDELRSPQAQTNRASLTKNLNDRLIATLSMYLQEPAPPDLAGGVHMIIELAIGIASHLPMESRDVVIEYFTPGCGINAEVMKLEASGIPPLANPMADLPDASQADRASLRSTASDLKDTTSGADDVPPAPVPAGAGPNPPAKDDKKSRGMLGGLMGTRKPPATSAAGAGKLPGASSSQASLTGAPPGSSGKEERSEPREPKVRIAAGLAVHVRGRNNVLIKAPVYSVG